MLVDPQQIRQALENLIAIAYQATTPREKPTVGGRSGRHEVSVPVADADVGISRERMDKFLESLLTTRARGTVPEVAASRMFVQAKDGSISVESKEGEGSRAKISLPLRMSEI